MGKCNGQHAAVAALNGRLAAGGVRGVRQHHDRHNRVAARAKQAPTSQQG